MSETVEKIQKEIVEIRHAIHIAKEVIGAFGEKKDLGDELKILSIQGDLLQERLKEWTL